MNKIFLQNKRYSHEHVFFIRFWFQSILSNLIVHLALIGSQKWQFSPPHCGQTWWVHINFIFSNESSILVGVINPLDKIFNRGKMFYEFSKLAPKSATLSKKSESLKFRKKNFGGPSSTHRDLRNLSKQIWCLIIYFGSRAKNRFCHIYGAEKGVIPLTPHRGYTGQKFFRH